MRLTWPSGHDEWVYDLSAGAVHQLTEGLYDTPKLDITVAEVPCDGTSILMAGWYGRGIEYEWSNGATTPQIEVNQSGKYSLRARQGGIDLFEEVDVEVPDVFDVSISTTPDDGSGTGRIDIDVVGGLPPYQIEWGHLSEPNDLTSLDDLQQGSYSLRVTDSRGCSAFLIAEVESKLILSSDPAIFTDISVFPNPAVDVLTIESADPLSDFLMYDISGRQVDVNARKYGNVRVEIDVSQLRRGIYVLQLREIRIKIILK